MRTIPIFTLAILLACAACKQQPSDSLQTGASPELELQAEASPELEFEHLRLYPILAGETYINRHAAAAAYQSLREAIGNHRFRITEKKPFGRFDDLGAVNTLTVQNKSEETAFLMAGDVVQGGKQDRVIAQDMVVPPRTIADIPVFCVEPHRWQAQPEEGPAAENDPRTAEQNKRIYAFTGYYNVAANGIRRSATLSKNQQEVWDRVGQVTALHKAESSTGAYAALEGSGPFTQARSRYLSFFEDKFDGTENVVGIVAVTGDEFIGADIFAHPELFKKQYKALIHSYITDAITHGEKVRVESAEVKRYEQQLWKKLRGEENSDATRYEFNGMMIHFAGL